MSVKLYFHKWMALIVFGSSLFGLPGTVWACQVFAGSAPTAPRIEYDVYGFARAIASTDFELTNDGDTDCMLDIIVEDFAHFPPPFEFTRAGVLLDVIAPGLQRPQDNQNIAGIFALALPIGMTRKVQLDFFTNQTVSIPAGLYEQDITIGIRMNGTGESLEEYITNLSLFSSSQAQINIAGTDGNFDKNTYMDSINFGEPEIGESQRVYVQARSNSLATMTIRSDNGGVMKHNAASNAIIAYSAILDNEILNLSSPHVISGLSATGLTGQSRALDFTIESLNNPYAGQYSDRIIIEIEAR